MSSHHSLQDVSKLGLDVAQDMNTSIYVMPGITRALCLHMHFKKPREEGIFISPLLWEVKKLVQSYITGNGRVKTPIWECLTPEP